MPTGVSKNQCGAKKATGSGVCTLNKGYGTVHPGSGRCKWHGGNTATGRTAAAKEAGQNLVKYVDPIGIEPTEALLQELARTAGHVAYLDQQIAGWKLNTAEEIPPHQEQWMRVHMVERAHMTKVAKTALDAGVAERQIRLAEQQGMVLASAIEDILNRLALTPAQSALIPIVVPEVLRGMTLAIEGEVVADGR
jgi:hypothetical protein